MNQKIIIEPVTRVEGHGKVTIHLTKRNVARTRLHIVEFRGLNGLFGSPILGNAGLCKGSAASPGEHHLAAAKALMLLSVPER
jgi:NAD-reducing hydrogenase large subunit